jgi:hypothetical protein
VGGARGSGTRTQALHLRMGGSVASVCGVCACPCACDAVGALPSPSKSTSHHTGLHHIGHLLKQPAPLLCSCLARQPLTPPGASTYSLDTTAYAASSLPGCHLLRSPLSMTVTRPARRTACARRSARSRSTRGTSSRACAPRWADPGPCFWAVHADSRGGSLCDGWCGH